MFHEDIFTVRAVALKTGLREPVVSPVCVFRVMIQWWPWSWMMCQELSQLYVSGKGLLIHFERVDKGRLHLLSFSHSQWCLEAKPDSRRLFYLKGCRSPQMPSLPPLYLFLVPGFLPSLKIDQWCRPAAKCFWSARKHKFILKVVGIKCLLLSLGLDTEKASPIQNNSGHLKKSLSTKIHIHRAGQHGKHLILQYVGPYITISILRQSCMVDFWCL